MSQLDSKVKGALTVGKTGSVFSNEPVGTDGQILTADSAQASGIKYVSPASIAGVGTGLAGLWIYGDGADGSVTLGANTTLALGDTTKNYLNLTLAGFTLTCDADDPYFVVCVKSTLAGGGGSLLAVNRTGPGNPPGTGGAAGGTSGAGGDGGGGAGALYVFARIIGGVTLNVSGSDGVDGTDGTVAGFAAGAGSNGTGSSQTMLFQAALFNPTNLGFQAGLADGTAGLVQELSAANAVILSRTRKDVLRLILLDGIGDPSVNTDMRLTYASPGGGGGGGNAAAGGTTVDAGGGASGGLGVVGLGGAGGTGVALATGAGDKASGGGGGSGGGAGLVHLICDQVTSATSLLANGGAGGDGGDGAAAGAGVARGGGGGGGGGGGIAVAIVSVGSGFLTLSASGGAAGTGGTSAGSGTAGGNGTAGGAGYTATLLKV